MQLFTVAATLLSVASVAWAQDQVITVGLNTTTDTTQTIFSPSNITADAGSVITFKFSGSPGNHSIVQSNFTNPCVQLEGGFSSGFVPVVAGTDPEDAPTWNITVTNVSAPIWFFCAQLTNGASHCGMGMVGSINAASTGKTFDVFRSEALDFGAASSTPAVPTPNLSGVDAQATGGPVGVNGTITGATNPTGTLAPPAPASSGSGSGTGTTSTTGSATSSPAPTSAATPLIANAGIVVIAALLGVAML